MMTAVGTLESSLSIFTDEWPLRTDSGTQGQDSPRCPRDLPEALVRAAAKIVPHRGPILLCAICTGGAPTQQIPEEPNADTARTRRGFSWWAPLGLNQ